MLPTDFSVFSEQFSGVSLLSLLAVTLLFAALSFFASRRFLLIAQQTRYNPRAVYKWYRAAGLSYKNRLMLLSLMSFLSFSLICSCFIPAFGGGVAAFTGFASFIAFTVMYIKTESSTAVKIPLRKTGREIRLAVTLCALFAAFYFGVSVLLDFLAYAINNEIVAVLRYAPLTLSPMLIPYAVIVAAAINKPFEEARNAKFVKSSAEILDKSAAVKIGVTGSFGKTGVKEILAVLLSERYNVLATPDSYNTPMGIALTVKNGVVANGKPADFFIAEMGAKHVGDIKKLCDIVKPNVGVLTAVNSQHLETFGDYSAVKRTKFELFENLYGDKTAFFSSDNEGARELFGQFVGDKYSAGINGSFARAENVSVTADGSSFTLILKGEKPVECKTSLLGEHNVSNLCLAAAVAYRLGVSAEEIARGIARCKPAPHRLQTINAEGGGLIIDDSYNSSEDGAAAALKTLGLFPGKKTVLTPGLVELGERQYSANFKLGSLIAGVADEVIVIGETNKNALTEGAISAGMSEESVKTAQTLELAVKMKNGVAAGETALFLNDLPDDYN